MGHRRGQKKSKSALPPWPPYHTATLNHQQTVSIQTSRRFLACSHDLGNPALIHRLSLPSAVPDTIRTMPLPRSSQTPEPNTRLRYTSRLPWMRLILASVPAVPLQGEMREALGTCDSRGWATSRVGGDETGAGVQSRTDVSR